MENQDRKRTGSEDLKLFEDDRFYRPHDPEMRRLANRSTLVSWRNENKGPPYFRIHKQITYLGRDLNEWLMRHRVVPSKDDVL